MELSLQYQSFSHLVSLTQGNQRHRWGERAYVVKTANSENRCDHQRLSRIEGFECIYRGSPCVEYVVHRQIVILEGIVEPHEEIHILACVQGSNEAFSAMLEELVGKPFSRVFRVVVFRWFERVLRNKSLGVFECSELFDEGVRKEGVSLASVGPTDLVLVDVRLRNLKLLCSGNIVWDCNRHGVMCDVLGIKYPRAITMGYLCSRQMIAIASPGAVVDARMKSLMYIVLRHLMYRKQIYIQPE
jgi:hypothetical protein